MNAPVDLSVAIRAMAACYETERLSADGWMVVAALDDLIAAAKAANERLMEATSYRHEDDDCGDRVCCDVLEYKDHEADCPAVRLAAVIARFGGAK